MAEYDLVVIGAGSGGITATVTAGGECTWSGWVPSQALIHEVAREQRSERSPDVGTASVAARLGSEVQTIKSLRIRMGRPGKERS